MRQIVLDTETTGLTVEDGHRIIEIGCVEVINRRLTGRHLHLYLNPEREVDEGARAVHGMSLDMLLDKPRFPEVAAELIRFVADAEVLIHNASFDVGFLDAELARLGLPSFATGCRVTDTLRLARELHPGKRNSLDVLCERYGISNAHRKLHGALLDAELLADVYLAMTRGQDSLEIALHGGSAQRVASGESSGWPPVGLRVVSPLPEERQAHLDYLAGVAKEIRRPALWSSLEPADAAPSA
jgi:DNA polymerase-3 subunit epsilon